MRIKGVLKLNQYDRSKVIENYYKAANALMEIGTTENVPEDLKRLTINASSAVSKIIDYVNTHNSEESAASDDRMAIGGFLNGFNNRLAIKNYINRTGYTYTVDNVLEEYKKKQNGYYVSLTMDDIISHMENEIKALLD